MVRTLTKLWNYLLMPNTSIFYELTIPHLNIYRKEMHIYVLKKYIRLFIAILSVIATKFDGYKIPIKTRMNI